MTMSIENQLAEIISPDRIKVDDEAIYEHSYDWWPVTAKWKQQGKQPYRPDVIVYPETVDEVQELLKWANQHQIPVTAWGAGSAVTGAPLPLKGGITLNLSLLNQVLEIDETSLFVHVQAGKMGHKLEAELNEKGYTLNHSPQSLDRSTVGGWIATRATGQFSSRWGGIEDLAIAFTVVLADGNLVATKRTPRAAIGPDIRHFFMGSEGTLGVVTEVTLKIFPIAKQRLFEAVHFETVTAGVNAIREIMQTGLQPFLVRFYDEDEARHAMQDKEFTGCVAFLGFEGLQAMAEAERNAALQICTKQRGLCLGPASVIAWMERRFDFSTVENILAQPGGYAETIEIAHFWGDILETYQALKIALAPLATEVLGHFSHVYTHGTSLYMILLGEAQDAAEAEAILMTIWETSMRICLEKGAVTSHHHGVGLARLPYIQEDLDSTLPVLQSLKDALDPNNILNPGKLGLRK